MSEEQAVEQTPPPPSGDFHCDQCPEVFMTAAGVRVHKARIHGDPKKRKQWARNIAKAVNGPTGAIRRAKVKKVGVKKLAYACTKCDKSFDMPQGLSMHTFRKHTPKGRSMKPWNMKERKKLGRPRKTAVDNGLVQPLYGQAPPPARIAPVDPVSFCPCCGFDLRALQVAMTLKVNKAGRVE